MLQNQELNHHNGNGATVSDVVLKRFSQYARLTSDEENLLAALASNAHEVPAGAHLLAESEALNRPRLMLAGWGCHFRTLSDGRRQIFEFILPGDIYGLSHRPAATAPSAAIALTRCTIADASGLGEAVLDAPGMHPGLVAACAAVASLDEAWMLNQLMRVGRQNAYERLAHLFLEIAHRLGSVGLADHGTISMPLTQEIIADAMGLSVVHLNRTLQQLRREGLIEFKNGTVKILKPDQLAAIADFRTPEVHALAN
ncbi:MAG TPA: Crp/Fnr family transcriptional regulator [Rhizomicrobium sp.]|nr:Crp/Fnr family transcriptional regulator [Rhizomicrobium sp.]